MRYVSPPGRYTVVAENRMKRHTRARSLALALHRIAIRLATTETMRAAALAELREDEPLLLGPRELLETWCGDEQQTSDDDDDAAEGDTPMTNDPRGCRRCASRFAVLESR